MMRKWITAFLLFSSISVFAELPGWALPTPRQELQISENGTRTLLPFVKTGEDVVLLDLMADGLKKTDMSRTGDTFLATLHLPGGVQFRSSVTVRSSGPEKLEWKLRLSADRPQKVRQLWFGLNLNPAMKGRELEFTASTGERVRIPVPEPEPGFRWIYSTLHNRRTFRSLSIPMRRGVLIVSGFETPLQVARHGKNGTGIRLLCETGERPVKELTAALTVEYHPWETHPFSLRSAANMGFADPIANDRTGGWTDQGPENDLSPMRSGRLCFGEIPFEIPDPEKNGGKCCLVFRNRARPHFLRSAEIPGEGAVIDYLYLLNAAAWVRNGAAAGTIRIRYQDGSSREITVTAGRDVGNWWMPEDLENGAVVWRAENRSAKIGLYLSRFAVEPKPIRSLELTGGEETMWMLVGMTGVRGKGIPFLTEAVREIPCEIRPGKVWKLFRWSKHVEPGSALDFSDFSKHAPAGKYGRVIIRNGRFSLEKRPEMPIRFFGTNVPYWGSMFSTDRELDVLPRRLRAVGYNAVRFHHFDEYIVEKGKSLVLKKAKMDRWHKTFARYKELGFYITLDLFTLRRDGFSQPAVSPDAFFQKALILFDPVAREEMKEFTRQLLGSVNPYTGMTTAEDPALLSVGLVNEDKMFTPHRILQYKTEDPRMSALLKRGFADWCRKHNLPGDTVPTDPAWAHYFADTHLELFREFKALLNELNCKAPVSDISSGYEYILAPIRNRFDYTDLHSYHDHPEFPGAKWKPPMEFEDVSGISVHARSPLDAAACRILGQPFLLTEWHFCAPNSWRSESGVLMGALSAFQGFDGIFDFWGLPDTGSGGIVEDEPVSQGMGVFDTLNDPISFLSSRIINFFYLRGDVAEAEKTIALVIPENVRERTYALDYRYWKRSRNAIPPDAFLRLGLLYKIGIRIGSRAEKKGEFFADQVAAFAKASEEEPDLFLKKAGAPVADERTSSTGQISFHPGKNRFQVVTPKSEALIQEEKENCGKALSVRENTTFSTIFAGSLDNRSLTESRHILFLHLTDIKPGNVRFTRRGTRLRMYGKGAYPYLLKTGSAEISLKNRAPGNAVLFALDVSGRRLKTIPFTEQNGVISFSADNDSGKDSPLAYELIRNGTPSAGP